MPTQKPTQVLTKWQKFLMLIKVRYGGGIKTDTSNRLRLEENVVIECRTLRRFWKEAANENKKRKPLHRWNENRGKYVYGNAPQMYNYFIEKQSFIRIFFRRQIYGKRVKCSLLFQ